MSPISPQTRASQLPSESPHLSSALSITEQPSPQPQPFQSTPRSERHREREQPLFSPLSKMAEGRGRRGRLALVTRGLSHPFSPCCNRATLSLSLLPLTNPLSHSLTVRPEKWRTVVSSPRRKKPWSAWTSLPCREDAASSASSAWLYDDARVWQNIICLSGTRSGSSI